MTFCQSLGNLIKATNSTGQLIADKWRCFSKEQEAAALMKSGMTREELARQIEAVCAELEKLNTILS